MKFTEEHEWLRVEGDIVVVGITEHASTQLGDIVFVELPEEGDTVSKDDEVVVMKSTMRLPMNPLRLTKTQWAMGGFLKSNPAICPKWTTTWTKQATTL